MRRPPPPVPRFAGRPPELAIGSILLAAGSLLLILFAIVQIASRLAFYDGPEPEPVELPIAEPVEDRCTEPDQVPGLKLDPDPDLLVEDAAGDLWFYDVVSGRMVKL